ncbi:MAG TPA: cytochrome c [Candidatus Angelobacter sp.]|nr:cytochrome c [Candidatus Angelobacter sp.]
MKTRSMISAALLACAVFLALAAAAAAKTGSKDSASSSAPPAAASGSSHQDESLHLEGERRFRANCARCHAAPPRFAPRMMGTIVRHMRVRATITDDDMRYILRYMTE